MTIWDRYPDISSSEMRNLVASAAQVLAASGEGENIPADPVDISTSAAARDLVTSVPDLGLAGADTVQELLEDDDTALALCRAVLDQVRLTAGLAELVAATYEERTQKMAGVELLLLAGALVVLAARIKEIKVGKGSSRITFYESSEAVMTFLKGLVAGIGG